MSEHKKRIYQEAERREWKVERRETEVGVVGIPCFVSPTNTSSIEVWVGIEPNSNELRLCHEWQQGAIHAAHIKGLADGKMYSRSGDEFLNGVIRQTSSSLVLSIKIRDRDYEDAWDALVNYVRHVYALFLGELPADRIINRPYTFNILGDQSPEAIEWRSLVSHERISVIGLGGVGAWIADLVVKADPSEVHGWDYDDIEPKNVLRMPGGLNPSIWIGRTKVDWFQETYSLIHSNIHGHCMRIGHENIQEMIGSTTFAFVAVDEANDRMTICNELENAGIPFVVAGLSLVRKERRVKVSMRIVTAHQGVASWREAIPQVGQAGQDDYGSLDLPDVYAMAASYSVQSWRKMRGQLWFEQREECLTYIANDQTLIVRGV